MNHKALESPDKETLGGLILVLDRSRTSSARVLPPRMAQAPAFCTPSFGRDMTRSGSQMETP
jgi:hypothetical protein